MVAHNIFFQREKDIIKFFPSTNSNQLIPQKMGMKINRIQAFDFYIKAFVRIIYIEGTTPRDADYIIFHKKLKPKNFAKKSARQIFSSHY